MYKNKKIAIVIPCYNESTQIGSVIESLPEYLDHIIIIDDKSKDNTIEVVNKYKEKYDKITLICHEKNKGNGGARITGIKEALRIEAEIVCLIDGDGQMDITELPRLLNPVVDGKADICKGNRFFSGEAWQNMPKIRYLGNAFLSLLTKIVSGYWHIADFQSGYFVIKAQVLNLINLDHIYTNYGFPNDLLIHANTVNAKVKDIAIRPVYNVGEKSGIRISKVIPRISKLLFKRFFWRMKEKYIIRDFHPLVFFYFIGTLLFLTAIPLGIRFFYKWFTEGVVPQVTALALVFILISAMQFIFFAMWFDMDYNKKNELNDD